MSNTQAPIALTPAQQTYRREILEGLRGGICTVIFTKTDGTERTMRCTLKQGLLPMQEATKADGANPDHSQPTDPAVTPQRKPKPQTNISVWDLEKEAWRSFNIGTVIKWKREY